MNTLSLRFWKHSLGLAALLAFLPPALPAQTAPLSSPTAPTSTSSQASMDEDIQALQREVGELRLHVESLQQENDDLKKRIPTSEEIRTAVENMIAASRAEINREVDKKIAQAGEDTRKDILAEVAKQMEALARDTNQQLEKLAHAIGTAPAPHSVTVTSAPSTPPSYSGRGIDYVVKHGETLAIICRNNHVTSKDILLLNPQLNNNPNHIVEGQHLFLPQREGSSAPSTSSSAPGAAAPSTAAPASSGNVLNFSKP